VRKFVHCFRRSIFIGVRLCVEFVNFCYDGQTFKEDKIYLPLPDEYDLSLEHVVHRAVLLMFD
jgi:hypothetical protein